MLNRLLPALLCAAAPVLAASGEAPGNAAYPSAEEATVRDVDGMLDSFKRSIWASTRFTDRDATGRTLQDDVAEFVLTDDFLAEFAKLRARMVEVHGEDGPLSPTLQQSFEELMERELCRSAAISSYWGAGQEAAIHEGMIRAMHERLESDLPLEAEFETLRARARISRDTLMQRLAGCASDPPGFVPAWAIQRLPTRADYDQIRARYAALIDAATAEGKLPVRRLEREAPCPAAVPPRQDDQKARVRSMPDVGRFYPPMDRALQIEGMVRVRVEWDGTGCVKRASVVGTSGWETLDNAALHVALEMAMDPMTIRGVPVSDSATLPVRFSLKAAE